MMGLPEESPVKFADPRIDALLSRIFDILHDSPPVSPGEGYPGKKDSPPRSPPGACGGDVRNWAARYVPA
jgi:hypothetical protein